METNQEYLKTLLANLKKPIPHQWRVQSYSKNKPVATVMAYIDARDTQEVLDAYCTYGWNRKHQMLNDRLYCAIGIVMPDGTIQWREDCGTESNEDKEKGQASDAFKRAGVNWGIGRFLYDMDIQYVTSSDKKEAGKFPYPIDEHGKRIYDMTTYINNKNPNAPKPPVMPDDEPEPTPKVVHPELLPGTAKWGKCVEGLATKVATLAKIMEKNTISEVNQALLLKEGKIMEEELALKAKGI